MKKIFLVLISLVIANALFSQTPLQKADTAFKNKDYYNAVNLYEKALKKATGEETKYINFQVGECYRYGNKYTEAITWYNKAISSGYTDDIINLNIGDMLLKTGEYDEAKTFLEKYIAAKPGDNMAKIKLESCDLGLKVQTDKPLFEVKVDKSLSSTASDYGIAYFKNKMIFASTRMEGSSKYDPATMQGFSDLYESTYDAAKGEWSKPSKVKGSINSNYNEGTFTFDSISKYCYYSQCNGETGKNKQCNIMYAYYDEAKNTWESSKLFDFNSQDFRTQQQSISSDGKTLFFSSDMPGGYGGADIYRIKKEGTVWGKPENLGADINTIGNDMFPFISGDTLLVFASDGLSGFGGLDVYMSSIKKGKFQKPVNAMLPINSSSDDFGLVFKNKKNEGFFCSNRSGGIGDDDIYIYSRIPVILTADGYVRDKSTEKGLSDAVVFFKGSDGSVDSTTTDNKGYYEYTKLKVNTNYSIKATHDGYLNDSKSLAVGYEIYSKEYNKAKGYDIDLALIKITKEEVKIDNIYYDYDKADLRPESKTELDKLINVLKETPEVNVQISAHTDERGAVVYNNELSQKRAQSVVDYLIAGGISADRLIAKGYGFTNPVIKNAKTEEQHQLNRRTTFKILNASDLKNVSNIGTYVAPTTTESKGTTTTITNSATNTNNTTTSQQNPDVTVTTTTTNSGTNTGNNIVTNNNPDNTSTTSTTGTTTTSGVTNYSIMNKFFVIAGSFKTETEAQAAVNALIAVGYANSVVVGKSDAGNWRIAYSGYKTKDEATADLPKWKQVNASAWVFEKK